MIFYELMKKLDYDQTVRVMSKGECILCESARKGMYFSHQLALSEVSNIQTQIKKNILAGDETVILIVEVE